MQEKIKQIIEAEYGPIDKMPDWKREEIFLAVYKISMDLFNIEFMYEIKTGPKITQK
jgi:hypothetical protein